MVGQRGATRPVKVVRYRDNVASGDKDSVAVEEPLEIRISHVGPEGRRSSSSVAVTMRTPGEDFDLVAGFLRGEGLVVVPEEIQEMTYCRGGEEQRYNVVEVRLRPGVVFDEERLRRNFYTSSSCGVCGKASLEAVEVRGCRPLDDAFRVSPALVSSLPDRLREGQGGFERTGGLHAAGVFDREGRFHVCREDVGRHNAVDKALGHLFLRRSLPAAEGILVVSGRASFEIVQKAAMAGVPVVVAVGAPSSLSVALSERFHVTLVGFARGGSFNVYSGAERLS